MAAATVTARFSGGPCDGKEKRIALRVANGGKVTCSGAAYVLDPSQPFKPPYHAGDVVDFIPGSSGSGGGGTSNAAANVAWAWSRWMRILAHNGPASHRRIQASTARARRIARKR